MSAGWHHTRSGSWMASELYCLWFHWGSWQAPAQTNGVGVPFWGCLALQTLATLGQAILLANLTPASSRTAGIAKTELSVVSMRIQAEVQQKLQLLGLPLAFASATTLLHYCWPSSWGFHLSMTKFIANPCCIISKLLLSSLLRCVTSTLCAAFSPSSSQADQVKENLLLSNTPLPTLQQAQRGSWMTLTPLGQKWRLWARPGSCFPAQRATLVWFKKVWVAMSGFQSRLCPLIPPSSWPSQLPKPWEGVFGCTPCTAISLLSAWGTRKGVLWFPVCIN